MKMTTNRYFLREGDSMNYMIKGIQALKESFFLGIIIYIVIFVLLYLFKKRRTISWNYMFEGIFCIYCVTLLNLTGIFTLSYSLNGPFNYNLLPFIGSSIVPILLNFALFFPLGFLLPLIFRSCRGNWMDLCQYFEHKKLKGYADFFNSSSSFCCGVI